ncbi:MAG: hypothetical protein M0Z53_15985 [Thermaerobacter sp.]|nr:hypothetical protein [Thermaerobacter sp.]
MQWMTRSLLAIAALLVTVNGGYWEWHHRLLAGALMVVTGIVGLLIAAGATAAHGDDDPAEVKS